jgi:hypothetical protein
MGCPRHADRNYLVAGMSYNQAGRAAGPSAQTGRHPDAVGGGSGNRERPVMADYHYVSTWQLQAPIEPVWTAISDLERLPTWYPGVQLATCPPKA